MTFSGASGGDNEKPWVKLRNMQAGQQGGDEKPWIKLRNMQAGQQNNDEKPWIKLRNMQAERQSTAPVAPETPKPAAEDPNTTLIIEPGSGHLIRVPKSQSPVQPKQSFGQRALAEAARVGGAAYEGFSNNFGVNSEDRSRMQAYLGEPITDTLVHTVRAIQLPFAVAGAGVNALSQGAVDAGYAAGLGGKNYTNEDMRESGRQLAETANLGLMGAGVEAPPRVGSPSMAARETMPIQRAVAETPKVAAETPKTAIAKPLPPKEAIERNPEGRPIVPKGGLPAEPKLQSNAAKPLPQTVKPKLENAEPQGVSAAATPVHELLRINKEKYESQLPKEPGLKESITHATDTVKKILAPQTLDESARSAEASIRKNIGRSVRDSERAKFAMEPYRKTLQQMDVEEQLKVLKWIQKPEEAAQRRAKEGSGELEPPAELKPFLKNFKDLMLDRRAKLEARLGNDTEERAKFKENYLSQMWRNPDVARDVLRRLGGKEGSGAFLKKSVIDDYEAGIRAGLVPVTTDPIEIAMRYIENVDRFVAINDTLEEGIADKNVVWRTPDKAPVGWVKLDGRARNYKGNMFQNAYAPPGFASVYNALVSKPYTEGWGSLVSGAQKVANSTTAFKLAFSAYHALNIAAEASISGVADSIDKLASGDVRGAAKSLPLAILKGSPISGDDMLDAARFVGKRLPGSVGKTVVSSADRLKQINSKRSPVTSVARGRQMLNAYLTGMGSPELQKVVQLAADANFRIAGKGRIADEYRFSAMGSLWDSWKKGLLKAEFEQTKKDIRNRPITGTAKAIVNTTARALESLSDPLFKYYVPMVKNGAYFDMVKTWLDAHPEASEAEQVAFARKASNIIDNRFGEMNQDNIFWHQLQKQAAQSMLFSYSYQVGTLGLVTGAAEDAVGLAKGKGWSTNLSYPLALPVVVGTMGAVYQYLKTGKPPSGVMDLMYPQTGGIDPTTGAPARAVLPSYIGQFINAWYNGITHELENKVNTIWSLLHAAWTGKDWREDPIVAVDDDVTDALKKWAEYASGTWESVVASQNKKGGTNISGVERFLGIREAPMFANDPKAFNQMKLSKRLQEDALKAWHDHTAELAAKGQRPGRSEKYKFVHNYIKQHRAKYGGTQ